KEELDLRDVDLAGIVTAFLERLAEREELDLEACGEFLVLIAALLELKARGLFPDEEAELAELGPEEAAEELARRLAEYRRAKEAALRLAERLPQPRYFRLRPASPAPTPTPPGAAVRLKGAGDAPPGPAPAGRPAAGPLHRAQGAPPPAGGAVPRALALAAHAPLAPRLRPGNGRFLQDRGRRRLPRPARVA